jgi:probable HAF family extracellular repeat protein
MAAWSAKIRGRLFHRRPLAVETLEDRCLPSNYTITDIGPIQPNSSTGMNNAAVVQVVGTTTTGQPFLWDSVHGMKDLGTVGKDQQGAALGVNDAGQVVGWSYTKTLVNGYDPYYTLTSQHAFLWTSARGMQSLGKDDKASGINAGGEVSGTINNTAAGLWTGNWTNLGTLGPNYYASSGLGINNFGQEVGFLLDNSSNQHAFLWTPSTSGGQRGTMQDLGTFGGRSSGAFAINSQGYVAGAFQDLSYAYHAFVWRPTAANGTSGTMITLGGEGGFASAINSSAVAVGDFTPTGTQQMDAALWQPGTSGSYTLSDLNSLIPTGTGWTLSSADAINDRGQIVVEATQANGPQHALLLTPTTTPMARATRRVQTAASSNAAALTTQMGNPTTSLLALAPQVPPFLGASDASSVTSAPTMPGNSSNPPADAVTVPADALDQVFAEVDAGLFLDGWSKGLASARRK